MLGALYLITALAHGFVVMACSNVMSKVISDQAKRACMFAYVIFSICMFFGISYMHEYLIGRDNLFLTVVVSGLMPWPGIVILHRFASFRK